MFSMPAYTMLKLREAWMMAVHYIRAHSNNLFDKEMNNCYFTDNNNRTKSLKTLLIYKLLYLVVI